MNGKKLESRIVIIDKNTPIRSRHKYIWRDTGSVKDLNYLVDIKLLSKLAFRDNIK